MSVSVGRYLPPPLKISITDGHLQYQFDTPAELVDYLASHPDLADRIEDFRWTTQEISGGH